MKNPLETPGTTIVLGLLLTAALYGGLRLTAPATVPAESTPAVEASEAPVADEASASEVAPGETAATDSEPAPAEPATP